MCYVEIQTTTLGTAADALSRVVMVTGYMFACYPAHDNFPDRLPLSPHLLNSDLWWHTRLLFHAFVPHNNLLVSVIMRFLALFAEVHFPCLHTLLESTVTDVPATGRGYILMEAQLDGYDYTGSELNHCRYLDQTHIMHIIHQLIIPSKRRRCTSIRLTLVYGFLTALSVTFHCWGTMSRKHVIL